MKKRVSFYILAAVVGAFATQLFFQLMAADEPIPPIQGELPLDPGKAGFLFGSAREGIRIGIASGSNEYRLNHRINVWTRIETATQYPGGHTLMSGDSLFNDSFLYVTTPDGKAVAKVGIGGDIDGMPGVGRMGGVSEVLHRAIRKPGTYKVQWKTGGWESGVVTIAVLPE